jgi:hypothetical protein
MTEAELLQWVRTNRRAPGTNWRSIDPERIAGPWHIQPPIGSHTRCGSEVARITSSGTASAPLSTPPEGRVCPVCVKYEKLGRQKPTTNRGRRW